MSLPGDQGHNFRLVAPNLCSELTAKAQPLAEVKFWVRGTVNGSVTAWHPETIDGKNYEVLEGSEGAVPPALQVDFRRLVLEKHR